MSKPFDVIIFYKYTSVTDPKGLMLWMRALCLSLEIKGRILIAEEGINGSVEGTRDQLDQFESEVSSCSYADFHDLWFKSSPGTGSAFRKLIIKVRPNILNIGLDAEADINPNITTGTHIEPEELHNWFTQGEDFAIVDMRNDYEFTVGRFKGSIDPGMKNFRDLKELIPSLQHLKGKKVLTVCTYGVRCEKASGLLLNEGFDQVYQLHGGIGTYMKKYPGQNFEGSLYVFDERMTEQFTDAYDVVGRCTGCNEKSERFGNCAWSPCHKQLIICENCEPSSIWCSDTCKDSMPQS
ncbi:rhodanese-related sulfurtransferase [Candidatus Uhrbacteria bacterium]|nr:rhodanese-related sulfurtransferase [Candidatus Uhrbacteria bacterium]